ncbi:MAG TPA: MFS transporter, partial [Spirochaetales bacterium]|nr:MFS transporter [Spirochaetales bacterium]
MSSRVVLQSYFPALQEKNFRIYWIGQCVSLIGTWMQNVGQSWLVLELTGSAQKLSIISALQFFPMMLFSAFAGPIIDAFPKKKILLFTQTGLAVLAMLLAILTWTKLIQYWMVVILALLLGFVQLIDNPTRHAFVIELSGKEALTNAVALNSAAFNLARMAGPAVAGILIEIIGTGSCFFLNSISFVAVIIALLNVTVQTHASIKKPESLKEIVLQTKDGVIYTLRNKNILIPLLLLGIISL